MFKITLLTFAVALLVGGWFYLFLQLRYDSFAAFNRPLHSFSLANQPPSFYSGLGNGKLFSEPVRSPFPNQLWPKFYADFWGDYETYFLVYGRDMRRGKFLPGIFVEEAIALDPPWLETNRAAMSAYLLHTTPLVALLSAGLLESVRAHTNVGYALIWLLIIFTYLALIPTFYTRYF